MRLTVRDGSARWNHYKDRWAILTYYQRFEGAVALVLTLVIALIVLVALYRLCVWLRSRAWRS